MQKKGSRAVGSSSSRKKATPRKKKRSLWRRIPLWAIITGVGAMVALYIFVFFHFFVDPFSFRWKAIYGDGVSPDGFEVRGIDVSHHQGTIDWSRLRNASINWQPLRFVFIKATEGKDLIDENFNENFYQARQNGIIRAAYHFFSPKTDARAQAHFFLRQVHLEAGDLPPVLDVETRGNLSTAELQHAVKQWLDVVEKHYGVKPIIYTGYKFKVDYLNAPVFNDYPYWIAHYYVNELKYKGAWAFWQYTDVGRIDGIQGFVDCNIFRGDLSQLDSLTIKADEIDMVGIDL